MKKILPIVFISVLLLNMLPIKANASTIEEHEYYLQYDSYGKRLYETIVEQTAFVSGSLTSNQDYIQGIKSEIKQHAKDSWEFIKFNPEEYNHAYGVFEYALDKGGALVLTATDWLKGKMVGLFGKQQDNIVGSTTINNNTVDFVDGYIKITGGSSNPYKVYGFVLYQYNHSSGPYTAVTLVGPNITYYSNPNVLPDTFKVNTVTQACAVFDTYIKPSYKYLDCYVMQDGIEVPPKKPLTPQQVNINNYYNNNYVTRENETPESPAQEIIVDYIKPILICGEDIKKLQYINNTLTYNSQPIILDDNERVVINEVDCTLDFTIPNVNYDENNDAIISDDEGNSTNLMTGEKEGETISPDSDCDGILCWVSNIFSVIGKVISAITDLGTTIISGIFSLIVPDDLNFITVLFDDLKTTVSQKFAITTDLQNLFKSIFTESTTNPLTGLSFTLPATDTEFNFGAFSIIDEYVPMIRRIISALIGLMTLIYIYRKIIGSGGVMEK